MNIQNEQAAIKKDLARVIADCVETHRPRYMDDVGNLYWEEIRQVLEEQCREELERSSGVLA
jgi:hypothetical protein